ncbi:MAG: hypothetical protein JWO38_8274 [Gemmataceae bacterium]|nr:hypothetical protein [Gemmataceae bacterium]
MNPFEPAILSAPADRSQQITYADWLADRDPDYSAALLADDFPATAWAAVLCGHGLRETWVVVESVRRSGRMMFELIEDTKPSVKVVRADLVQLSGEAGDEMLDSLAAAVGPGWVQDWHDEWAGGVLVTLRRPG